LTDQASRPDGDRCFVRRVALFGQEQQQPGFGPPLPRPDRSWFTRGHSLIGLAVIAVVLIGSVVVITRSDNSSQASPYRHCLVASGNALGDFIDSDGPAKAASDYGTGSEAYMAASKAWEQVSSLNALTDASPQLALTAGYQAMASYCAKLHLPKPGTDDRVTPDFYAKQLAEMPVPITKPTP
jgi:hypothetical protein